jgi:hypothetical protein
MGRVFEHEQPAGLGKRFERHHVADLAVHVNGNYRCGTRAGRGSRCVGIEQPGALLDVAQHRSCAGMHDRQRRRDRPVGGKDHLVTRTDPVSLEDQGTRRGARCHTDAVCDLRVGCELRLESLELLAKRERARAQQTNERTVELVLDRRVLPL